MYKPTFASTFIVLWSPSCSHGTHSSLKKPGQLHVLLNIFVGGNPKIGVPVIQIYHHRISSTVIIRGTLPRWVDKKGNIYTGNQPDFPMISMGFSCNCSRKNQSIDNGNNAGWWYEPYPSEKYEFVNWDDDSKYMGKSSSHVPGKPPTSSYIIVISQKNPIKSHRNHHFSYGL